MVGVQLLPTLLKQIKTENPPFLWHRLTTCAIFLDGEFARANSPKFHYTSPPTKSQALFYKKLHKNFS
jgi:hypothetical protein